MSTLNKRTVNGVRFETFSEHYQNGEAAGRTLAAKYGECLKEVTVYSDGEIEFVIDKQSAPGKIELDGHKITKTSIGDYSVFMQLQPKH